jgi:hypothetical protein
LKKIIPSLSNVIYSTRKPRLANQRRGDYLRQNAHDNDMLMWMDRKGEVITYSQSNILKALECSLSEPALERLDEHHDLVSKSIEQINSQEISVSGTLGRRFSTKYRVYTLLEAFCNEPSNGLFITDELKIAMDDIYNYPLQDNARVLLTRQLKKGVSAMEMVELVVELRNEEELSIKNKTENKNKEPQIICSLGLRNME